MAQVLWTLLELVFQLGARILLKSLVVVQVYSIPKFRLAQVQVVDWVQVHVLFVPCKHRFPGAEVQVGVCHAQQFSFLKPVTKDFGLGNLLQQCVNLGKIPRNPRVKQSSWNVSSVDWSTVFECFPKLKLGLSCLLVSRCPKASLKLCSCRITSLVFRSGPSFCCPWQSRWVRRLLCFRKHSVQLVLKGQDNNLLLTIDFKSS